MRKNRLELLDKHNFLAAAADLKIILVRDPVVRTCAKLLLYKFDSPYFGQLPSEFLPGSEISILDYGNYGRGKLTVSIN